MIRSEYRLFQHSLELLVSRLGFEVVPLESAQVAIWDLCLTACPFPSPPPLPSLAIILESRHHALEVLQLGYRGYFYAAADPAQIKKALAAIAHRELWAERQIIAEAFETRSAPNLTLRERAVLSHVGAGLTNKEIAHKLDVAESTVKGHVSKLLDKLNVKNRAGLILSRH